MSGVSSGSSITPQSMADFSAQQEQIGEQLSQQMMGQVMSSTMDQIHQTLVTGQAKMVASLAEAIAKTFKALGDAVKGLC